jgi:restriction endonuclease S subunit
MPAPASKIDTSFSTEFKSKQNIMASVEAFKSAILRIRDIFRSLTPSITGMESMRHICLYLLSLYITKDKVKTLGVPDEFAWENLIEMAQTKNGGVQNALDFFFHIEADCLVKHFDRLFGTRDFSFDIKNPAKHKEILELLSNKHIDIKNIDLNMDILGWVYEQHLGKGSGGNAMRDLGQFFTDRSICDYMVGLCKPGFKGKGVPESVCDPSMGTGGFLTSYMKFYKKKHTDTPVDWSVQNKEIHGCDTDQKVAGVARLNVFMESGGSVASNLLLRNSLNEDLIQTGYDLILANMPFGLKGIKHAECCERVKDLKIRGTKSEPLFLQLMMVSLNRDGRCAVVVPDGMLVNVSSCHDETRKYLLDNFELKRVIKMKGQFFMNTGIQPSILFFENTGKPTSVVQFWDVIKGVNGDIEETMVLSVPRAKFDTSCSFDMRRYQEVKAVANPAGFPMVKLSDLCELLSGKTNNDRERGDIPFYDSNGQIGLVDKHLFDGDFIITARVLSIGSLHFVSGKFWAGDNTINIRLKSDITNVNIRYIYYWLKLNSSVFQNIKSGIIPKVRKSDVAEIKIPLPPLEIQQEIVATLDRIYVPGTTELAETLKLTDRAMDLVLTDATAQGGSSLEPIVKAQRLMRKSAQMVADVKEQMVADVKAQMVAVVKGINMSCKEWTSIGNLYNTPPCRKKFNSKDMDNTGNVPFFNGKFNSPIGNHSDHSFDSENPYFVMIKDGGGNHSSDSVGMGKFFNVTGKTAITSHNLILTPKVVNHQLHTFITIYLRCLGKEIRDKAKYSISLGSISVKDILEFPIPSLRATELASANIRLELLQTQLTSLENLGKQAEDNARFILDSYLNTA